MAETVTIQIDAKTASAIKKLAKLNTGVMNLSQGFQLLSSAADIATRAFSVLAGTVGSVVQEGRNFTAQMSAVRSVTNLTAKDFAALTEEARRIGATTAFTATQAAKGMEELARAGFKADKILRTTAKALDLAAATGTDLAKASNVLATTLNIFADQGLKAQKAVDLMTKTVGASPQTFENLSYALETSQAMAATMGVSFQDLTVILGAMANAGIRGEKAGTALNSALASLSEPTSEARKRLERLGIAIEDINPKTNSFGDILDRLKEAGVDTSDTIAILGREAGPKFAKLISQGSDALKVFADRQKEATNAAEAAKLRLNNLEGDITKFNSALSDVKLDIFTTMERDLRDVVQLATEGLKALPEIILTVVTNFKNFKLALNGVGTDIRVLIVNGKILGAELILLFDKIASASTKGTIEFVNFVKKLGLQIGTLFKSITLKIRKFFVETFASILQTIKTSKIGAVLGKTFDLKSVEQSLNAVSRELKQQQEELKKTSSATVEYSENQKKLIKDSENRIREQEKIVERLNLEKQAFVNVQEAIKANITANEKLLEAKIKQRKEAEKLAEVEEKAAKKTKKKDGKAGTDNKNWLTTEQLLTNAAKQVGSQIAGVGGAIQGYAMGGPMGALIGGLTDLLLSNEKFAAILGKISETMVSLLDPIIDAIAPALEAIVPLLEELKPFIKLIANLLKQLIPLTVNNIRLLGDLIRGISNFTDAVSHFTTNLVGGIKDFFNNLADAFQKLPQQIADGVSKALEGTGQGIVSGAGGLLKGAGELLGFNRGGEITSDRMIRLPGMEPNAGLVKAHVGERIESDNSSGNNKPQMGGTFIFNIQSINPREQQEEIVQIIEEQFLTGRLTAI